MRYKQPDLALPGSTLRIATADMAALKVRIRGRHRPEPPELFYQSLPPEGIALLATIPSFTVSIPSGGSSWRGGWPFAAAQPELSAGPVVVYQLQPSSCRYTAVAVHESGHYYNFCEFIKIAERRMRNRFGNIVKIRSRYAYSAPDKEEWGSILRDDGYAALNPEKISSIHPAPVLPPGEAERFGHVIQVRAPVYSGDKLPARNPLPVFSRVEILTNSGGESRWLSFDNYQKSRGELDIVPGVISAGFSEWLACLTKESGFDRWRFRPGMAFGERTEWWGPRGRRRTVHEGLDFVEGFRGGEVSLIPEGVPVRAIASGEIAATLDDFMGKTVVVRHPSLTLPCGKIFHTLLSHIQTEGPPPSFVRKGDVLGRVGRRAGIRIRPHLHLTGAWFPADFPFAKAGIDTVMHPGFTPAILADLNNLIETSLLCTISPDDREFLAGD
jgi:murein DD-endopeptidase MepM/ murein hydrolase activator NlpD